MDILKKKAVSLGLDLSDDMLEKFDKYYHMIAERNKVMNLTAVTDYEMTVDKHFIDSLSVVKCFDISSVTDVIDIGTGAGFPGVPLKIVFPHIHLTLLDSVNKKVMFLNDVINELMFDNTEAIHFRAEDAARLKTYREKYDLAVSRAVANMSVLSEYCMPFVKSGGTFIAYKSGNSEEEIDAAQKAVRILGGDRAVSNSFILPETDISRTLVLVDKKVSTPGIYPRKAGIPSKHPLS